VNNREGARLWSGYSGRLDIAVPLAHNLLRRIDGLFIGLIACSRSDFGLRLGRSIARRSGDRASDFPHEPSPEAASFAHPKPPPTRRRDSFEHLDV
jgi:hypothetical protein